MAKRLKQRRIPGTELDCIPEIDQAAEAYYDAVRARLPYTTAEKEAKETLINKMVENRQVRYEFDAGEGVTLVVNLTDSKNVSVKAKEEPEETYDE